MASVRTQLIEEFMESARSLGRALWAAKAKEFERLKLHPAQLRLLYFVRHKPVSISQVAGTLCTSPSAATQLVDALVRASYLERVPVAQDRRKVTVRLTDRGRAKFERMRQHHLQRMSRMVSALSDAELKTLIRIQHKVAAHASR